MSASQRQFLAARTWNRREFVTLGGSLVAWPMLAPALNAAYRQRVPTKDYPFKLGVASGDPTPDGFVLWTRLAPEPLKGGGMPKENVEVKWQVASDEKMTKLAAKGSAIASPELAHSVHIEVTGLE